MPRYDYKCRECDHLQEGIYSHKEADDMHPECEECGSPTDKVFIPSRFEGQMFLRGEWPGKLMKENTYRQKRSEHMAQKQRDNHQKPELQPNVDGERTETWREAKMWAKDKGHDTTHYDDKVRRLSKAE